VPAIICLEPELHTVGTDTWHVQRGMGTPLGGSVRENDAAVHFLLTKETGLMKI
jgi:hypothetical protein